MSAVCATAALELQAVLGVVARAPIPDAMWALLSDPEPYPYVRMFRATANPSDPSDFRSAISLVQAAPHLPPFGLLPVCVIDESSLACVVLNRINLQDEVVIDAGSVVRCFITVVDGHQQLRLLDTDLALFLESMDVEIAARLAGIEKFKEKTSLYQAKFLDEGRTPQARDERPVGLACQNVVVGIAALRYDDRFDGQNASIWQTCEVPHVATHEADRALAAVTLCDAFRGGGTMEVRFDGHPEEGIPASLHRLARTYGIDLGRELPGSISPGEARELFLAVTPMNPSLRSRADEVCQSEGFAPERICYLLMQGVWSAVELEFMLRCARSADRILAGGTYPLFRVDRQLEMHEARCARMIGLLHRRMLTAMPGASRDGESLMLALVEDTRPGVSWVIHEELGAVTFAGLEPDWVAWTDSTVSHDGTLVVLPRPWLDDAALHDLEKAQEVLGADHPVVALVPGTAAVPEEVKATTVLRCPLDLPMLDAEIERALLSAEVGRG